MQYNDIGNRSERRGSLVYLDCWSCSRWLSRCGTVWASRTSSKFHQAFTLPLVSTTGSLQSMEIYHNTMTEASRWAYRRRTHAGWRRLRGRFVALRIRPIPGEDTSYCPGRNIRGSTNNCSFHTRHWRPNYTPSVSFCRLYHGEAHEILPVKRDRWSEFVSHCFVTTGSITMKHSTNWVRVLVSRSKHFHEMFYWN